MKTFLWTLAALTAMTGCSKKKTVGNEESNKKPVAQKKEAPRTQHRQAARHHAATQPMTPDVEAVVADIAGDGTIQSPGMDARPVTKDTTVHPGDVLHTAHNGRITLVLWDRTAVDLAPDSALLVEGSNSVEDPSPGITIMLGLVHVEAAKRKPGMGPLVVHTPNAAVAVTGTALDVGVGLDATARVGVEKGTVAVTPDSVAEPVELPHGKALVITAEGKTTKVSTYHPAKANWDAWLDKTNKAAQAKADLVVEAHKKAIDELKNNARKLDAATTSVVKDAESSMAQAEKAVVAKKEQELTALQPKVVAAIDSASAAYQTQRMFESQLQARAFLIAMLAAQAKAGLIRLPKAKAQVVADSAKLFPVFRIRWKNFYRRSRPKWHSLQRGYYRFHPRGWRVGAVVGSSVKPVTVDLKFKPRPYRPVRVAVPGYTRPLYRPPFVTTQIRPGMKVRLHLHGWHRAGSWQPLVTTPGMVQWRKLVVARRLRRRHRGPRIRIQWRGPGVVAPGIRIRGGAKAQVHLKPVHVGPGGVRAPGIHVRGGSVRAGNLHIRGPKIRGGANLRIRGPKMRMGGNLRRKGIRVGNMRIHMRGMKQKRRHGMGHGMGHE